jgi:hypothetical protein
MEKAGKGGACTLVLERLAVAGFMSRFCRVVKYYKFSCIRKAKEAK